MHYNRETSLVYRSAYTEFNFNYMFHLTQSISAQAIMLKLCSTQCNHHIISWRMLHRLSAPKKRARSDLSPSRTRRVVPKQYDPSFNKRITKSFFDDDTYADSVRGVCSDSKEGSFLSGIPRTVDGAVLDSRDERDEDCVITFQTQSILEKFLLKFNRLHMDCHDHLYIYDGAHATGTWRVSGPNPLGSHHSLSAGSHILRL